METKRFVRGDIIGTVLFSFWFRVEFFRYYIIDFVYVKFLGIWEVFLVSAFYVFFYSIFKMCVYVYFFNK